MKNRYLCILLAALCILTFAACDKNGKKPTVDEGVSAGTNNTDKVTPDTSTAPDKQDSEPPAQTPDTTEDSDNKEHPDTQEDPDATENTPASPDDSKETNTPMYIVRVIAEDHPIYTKPDSSSEKAGTVETAGSYTVVEEAAGKDGTLWGRLLSGAGWIEISGLYRRYTLNMMLTADYATAEQLQSENTHKYVLDHSQYTQPICITAHRTLNNFVFSATEFGDNARMNITETLYTLPELKAEKPLVAYISFPGDFTTFAITFSDDAGVQYTYYISQSGKDGSLCLTDITY